MVVEQQNICRYKTQFEISTYNL